MKKISTVIFIALAMLFAITPKSPVLSESDYREIEVPVGEKVAGEIIEVKFEEGVDPTNIVVTEGIAFKEVKGDTYYFVTTKDIDSGLISLWKKVEKGETETDHEHGDNNHVGKPGDGEGEVINWGSFELGKHSWDMGQGEYQFAIRINVEKYQGHDYIYLHDLPINLVNLNRLRVSILAPDEDGLVENKGSAQYEVLESEEGFVLKIKVEELEEGQAMRYDVVYYMDIENQSIPHSNSYRVYTKEEWEIIESGGSAGGEKDEEQAEPIIPEEPPVEEPEEPETPPVEEPVVPEEPTEDKPEEPVIPEEPTIPEVPTVPEEPIKPTEPDKPLTDEPKESPDKDTKEDTPSTNVEPVRGPEESLPPTGVSNTNLIIAVSITLLGIFLIKRSK